MSLIVLGILAGVAAAAGAAFGTRAILRRSAPRVVPRSPGEGGEAGTRALPGIDMQLGDVVLFGQEEVWLKGALLLEEARTCVAAVFFTHQGPEGDVVVVQPAPRSLLLRMLPAEVRLEAGSPPSVVEYAGRRFTRTLRRPVEVQRLGGELPATDATAIWAWFESADGTVLATLSGTRVSFAWTADPTADSSAVRLAAGGATFRSP